MPEAIYCQWLSWKCSNTHVHQVSAPCIIWFESLKSEEVVMGKSAMRGGKAWYTCVLQG